VTTTAAEHVGIRGKLLIELTAPGPRGWIERKVTFVDANESFIVGVSPAWYDKYHVGPGDYPSRPTTNDLFAASVASCLTGVFGGALEARGMEVNPQTLSTEVFTDFGPASESDQGWIIRSIRLVFHVSVDESQRRAVERAHASYERKCLISQTLKGSRCDVTSEVKFI
jgi:organic hydroperoxide reductase OsmC/OhrA